ncbi:MAG: hypothetical protein SFV18_19105 [Bryobacteraceae bacterium]|nr:hypothetical protein [Bryobacteraceae bacterium]
MSWKLKPIAPEAVPAALDRAHHYRLLNEPSQAASICQDVLAVDPANQQALITLALAMTDQFGRGVSVKEAREVVARLSGDYDRAYYSGIVSERAARWQLRQGAPGARFDAHELFVDAMTRYERAESIRPAGNDDAILRWNTCARYLMRHPEIAPRMDEALEPILSE